jgi:hypothetical protein
LKKKIAGTLKGLKADLEQVREASDLESEEDE